MLKNGTLKHSLNIRHSNNTTKTTVLLLLLFKTILDVTKANTIIQ